MSLEGPPQEPEKLEREPITREQCLEAMKGGNFETVSRWYEQRQAETDALGPEARVDFALEMAALQVEAGLDDYARDTILDGIIHTGITQEATESNLTDAQRQELRRLRQHLDI